MNVLKQYITRYLLSLDDEEFDVIKNGNDYKSLRTEKLHFLDISSYLAPGFSLDQYLKAFETSATKAFFPYEWFDSLDKLKTPHLPPHEAFNSSLKNRNITEADYKQCQFEWHNRDMKTFEDYLAYYNNSGERIIYQAQYSTRFVTPGNPIIYILNTDVEPFVMALEKQHQFFKSRKLDFARDAVSIPGLELLCNALLSSIWYRIINLH